MAVSRNFYRDEGSLRRGRITLHGTMVMGAGGAISTNVDRRSSGFTVTKTGSEAGRYTITFDDIGYTWLGYVGNIMLADDAAATDAKGYFLGAYRDNDLATDGTIEIQAQDPDSMADAELQDSVTVNLTFFLADKPVL